MKQNRTKVSILEYQQFSTFLQAAVADLKAQGFPVSYTWIARQLGYRSRSTIAMLLSGSRQPSKPFLCRLSAWLGLNQQSLDYALTLAKLGRARKETSRTKWRKQLEDIRNQSSDGKS